MTSRQLITLFPLLLLATFSGWLAYKNSQAIVQNQNAAQNPDSFTKNVAAMRMNVDSGTPQDELFAPNMVHYPAGDTTNVTTPHIVIFNADGTNNEPWHIYSLKGQAQNGTTIVQLWDHVRLHQAAGPNNSEMTITTSALTVYPKDQYATTQQPVQLVQPGGVANSVGLRADLKTGDIQLFSQARGHYQQAPAATQ